MNTRMVGHWGDELVLRYCSETNRILTETAGNPSLETIIPKGKAAEEIFAKMVGRWRKRGYSPTNF